MIPIKGDEAANEAAMNKVRADKLREVIAGHDGTWIAHPLINKIAMDIFDKHMLGPHQYHVRREDVKVTAADLLNTNVPGQITEDGVKSNVSAALAYSAAWIAGNGCIPLNNLMEDAATAEIARLQLWQWAHHGALLDSGDVITSAYIGKLVDKVAPSVKSLVAGIKDEHLAIAVSYLKDQVKRQWASDFLTSDLMVYLEKVDGAKWVRSSL